MSNLIDYSTLTIGYIQNSNGVVLPSAYSSVTDFIAVSEGEKYTVNFKPINVGWTWISLSYFDENFNYISEIDLIDVEDIIEINEIWTCPPNVAYVRISAFQFEGHISNFSLVDNSSTVLKLYENGDIEVIDTPLLKPNLVKQSENVDGYILGNGSFVTEPFNGDTYQTTNFIEVIEGEVYECEFKWNFTTNNVYYWFEFIYYDANYSIVSTDYEAYVYEKNIYSKWICPENVKYIRISYNFVENYTDLTFTAPVKKLSISKNGLLLPPVIEYPPSGYRNYFIEKDSVEGYLNNNGAISSPNEDDRTSDFINVEGWGSMTIRIRYVGMDDSYYAWTAIHLFDENKELYDVEFDDYLGRAVGDYLFECIVPVNVSYIRVSTNYYDRFGVSVKVSVERGITDNVKHYLAFEDMPEWVRDTGNPISFFPEGIVIKGNLIRPSSLIIFSDDFNRNVGEPLGGEWEIIVGGFVIANYNNQKIATPTSLVSGAVIDANTNSNISISADVTPIVNEGFVLRYVDADNYVFAELIDGYFVVGAYIDGDKYSPFVIPYDIRPRNAYNIRVELRGVNIKAFVDDVMLVDVDDVTFANSTKYGIFSIAPQGSSENGCFDNFIVERLTL